MKAVEDASTHDMDANADTIEDTTTRAPTAHPRRFYVHS